MPQITHICPICQKSFQRKPSALVNDTPCCSNKCARYFHQKPLETRFWEKVQKTDSCWLWTGSLVTSGYGQINISHRNVPAHRWSYEQLVGPIPDGLELDHLCMIKNCVNPTHLEPVPHQENTKRSKAAHRKEVCKRGHSLSPDNVYLYNTSRVCKNCAKMRDKARKSTA